jgi:hypothetical protein
MDDAAFLSWVAILTLIVFVLSGVMLIVRRRRWRAATGWRRRVGPICLGSAMLFLSLYLLGVLDLTRINKQSIEEGFKSAMTFVEHHKPFKMVVANTRSTNPQTAEDAVSELYRREYVGELSDGQERWVIQRALDLQGDGHQPWGLRWGESVIVARMHGRVSDADWDRFRSAVLTPVLNVRPAIRRGDPIPIFMSFRFKGASSRMQWKLQTGTAQIGQAVVPYNPLWDMYLSGPGYLSDSPVPERVDLDSGMVVGVPDGPCDVALRLNAICRLGWPNGSAAPATRPADSLPPITLVASTTLFPSDHPTAWLVHNPLQVAAETTAISCLCAWYEPNGDRNLHVTIVGDSPPISVAAVAFAKIGNSQWRLGEIRFRGYGGPQEEGLKVPVPSLPAGPMTVVLQPSLDVAVRSYDLSAIWGDPIAISNITVDQRPDYPF